MMGQAPPHIVALFRPGDKGAKMEPLEAVDVIVDFGFAGDRKARVGSKRQVLLLEAETIRELGLQPGDLDENITTSGLAVSDLRRGQQVRIGDVLLEITIVRPTCHKLEEIRPGLSDEMGNRRGMMARVLKGGHIRAADPIEVLVQQPA